MKRNFIITVIIMFISIFLLSANICATATHTPTNTPTLTPMPTITPITTPYYFVVMDLENVGDWSIVPQTAIDYGYPLPRYSVQANIQETWNGIILTLWETTNVDTVGQLLTLVADSENIHDAGNDTTNAYYKQVLGIEE